MDTAPWLQPSSNLEAATTITARPPQAQQGEKRTRPQKEQALNCPRCNSTNTKFCYYNNYSLTQPRYFCKTCRRYWTEGGSLRNVPVGGGSRKNKRSTTTTSTKKLIIENPTSNSNDLNLCFSSLQPMRTHTDALELLRSGVANKGVDSFMAMPMHEATTPAVLYPQGGFILRGFVDGSGVNACGTVHGGGLFPFVDVGQVGLNGTGNAELSVASGSGSGSGFDQRRGDCSGFWSGVIGDGGATW